MTRPQRALAAGLDLAVGRLQQDGEVAVEPAAALARHPAEAVHAASTSSLS